MKEQTLKFFFFGKKKKIQKIVGKKVSEKLVLGFYAICKQKKTLSSNLQENQVLLQRQALISSEKQQVEVFFGMQNFKQNIFILLCLVELFEEEKKNY